ncbi:M48 family metallopeptidase [Sphingomonas sp. MG17]|uniref:M48 family metallopeptidase n=1 Tax=Sphingomonas tagetis TaxID=2949092 RepID=A0A9X2HR59_9SPHN|nr:M48 family metallopeptidase [Sphingomonas tagetis]MCP3732891.1 M48 family metallopeptidase [Sphingomonas tagetis]
MLEALRVADLQLASIGFRLSVAGAPLCDRLEPGTGLQLHTLAQYAPPARDGIRAHFGLAGPVGVEGVVPGSPAVQAGVRADDTLMAINGTALAPAPAGEASTAQLAALHQQLAALPPTAPIDLTLSRAGRRIAVRVQPVAACFSRYELRIGNSFDARANGELVQITSKYLEAIDGDLLPAVVAHELSHNILRHRERLAAAGAEFGFASGFGRNVGLFRQTEIEADILAVHLLARARYSPHTAARFWREAGPRLMAGIVRSRSHPPLRDRIDLAVSEAARFTRPGAPPAPPPFLAKRNQPLDGDWRKLLPPSAR